MALNIFRKFRATHAAITGFVNIRRQVKRKNTKGIVYLWRLVCSTVVAFVAIKGNGFSNNIHKKPPNTCYESNKIIKTKGLSWRYRISWLSYEFSVHELNVTWSHVGAVYLFCGVKQPENQWIPLYVGRADDLADRLSTHERWPEAVQLGANRERIERELIQAYQPQLNVQLR